ncbi:hypothetical protein [Chitinophaga silvisoli]|uniref:Uncharacterized protein n=1 Tax=Chitinophaga silvisoli TaxID=2291814 RepID=A0A3E1P5P1_9BACT|nr:hypothetical protein [Chitinophaga silvisoli]RFM35424.1 hypothetical protein DXN04_08525 [Chitinophaga silvisoli]
MLLNVSGFKIYKLKQYQHRTKHRHDAGYSGRITQSGRIYIQRNWYTTISTKNAYIVGCQNMGTTPASIHLHFSVYNRTGQKVNTFIQSTSRLLPGKSCEIPFDLTIDKAYVKLEGVEVYREGEGSAYTPVMRAIPPMIGIKASLAALLLCFVSAMALTEPHVSNAPSVLLPLIAIITLTMTILNRTPIWFMFIFLVLVPFSGYKPEMSTGIFAVAIGYLFLVWNKRGSLKDFLCPYSTPWLLV